MRRDERTYAAFGYLLVTAAVLALAWAIVVAY